MASIFVTASTATAANAIVDALTSLGHDVHDGGTGYTIQSQFDAGDYDLIVCGYKGSIYQAQLLQNEWPAGVPIMLTCRTEDIPVTLGLTSNNLPIATNLSPNLTTAGTHPIVDGYSGTVTVRGNNYGSTAAGPVAGTVIATDPNAAGAAAMMAVEAGDPLLDSTPAPARAVVAAWFYTLPSADGLAVLGQAVDWLVSGGTPTTPEGAAATSHVWTPAAAGEAPSPVSPTVVETARGSTTATLTAPIQSTDVIVVVTAGQGNANVATSISGLGATWDLVGEVLAPSTSFQYNSVQVWRGVGPTAATGGVVTPAWSGTSSVYTGVLVARGTSSEAVSVEFTHNNRNSAEFAGPSLTAGDGSIVAYSFTRYDSGSVATYPTTQTPSTGWVDHWTDIRYTWTRASLATAVPSAGGTYGRSASGASNDARFAGIVIGGSPPASQGAATVEHSWTTSAVGEAPVVANDPTVVEVITSGVTRFSDPPVVTLTEVQPGDVIVLLEATNQTNGWTGGVSGLGATWTLAANSQATNFGTRFWIGTDPTSAGDVTLTAPLPSTNSVNGRAIRAYVLRGVTSTFASSSATSGSVNLQTTPPIPAQVGQIAIGAGYSDNASSTLHDRVPGSGWLAEDAIDLAGNNRFANSTSRLPPENDPIDHSVTAYRLGGNATASLTVVGDPAPTGPTGIASLAHEWTPQATGYTPQSGTATTSHGWTLAATGDDMEPGRGTATLAHEWSTTAVGDDTEPNYGTTTLEHVWTLTAVGETAGEGVASLAHEWTLTATGDDTEPAYGTAALAHEWTSVATGTDGEIEDGTATLAHSWSLAAVGDNNEVELEGWVLDQSQQIVIDITGSDMQPAGPLLVDRVVALPPPELVERPISVYAPQPTVQDFTVSPDGSVHADGLWPVVEGTLGVVHTWVDGLDVTYFRDRPMSLSGIVASQPFGWEKVQLTFPQINCFEEAGVGSLAWLRPGAQVEAFVVDTNGQKIHEMFSGHLASDQANAGETTATVWEAVGDMGTPGFTVHHPPISMDATDIGVLVAKVLNSPTSRRYATIAPVITGIETLQRGSTDDYVLDYASELLATAWTQARTQWTVARGDSIREYEIRLKDRTTRHWSVVPGTQGISVSLTADHSTRSDAIFGRGVGPDGYAWSGRHWPSLLNYDPPDYPNSSASNTIMPGESDASTDSGDGVSVWERRARDLGYDVPVDGYLSANDSNVVRDIQRKMGLLVDGIIGPQTWTGTWEVGVDAAALKSIRLPIAFRSEVEPNLYSAVGAVIGENPDYDPRIMRYERAVDYGSHVTKRVGTRTAELEVQRTSHPGWTGSITFVVDPQEGSRFLMREGQNILVRGWRGQNVLCHIVKITFDTINGTVTCEVDSKARDAMDLASLRRRDQDAQVDPARRPGNVTRKSRQAPDLRTTFEGDSPAGRIHRRALFGGLWSVFPVPISEAGNIVKLDVHTESPAAEFSLGFFASPVLPSQILRLVGNPLADGEAWKKNLPVLEDMGFIEAWGAGESMAGHWPSQEGPVTGRLIDTGGWSYHSNMGGWVWIAAWSPASTFIEGRVFPAPID